MRGLTLELRCANSSAYRCTGCGSSSFRSASCNTTTVRNKVGNNSQNEFSPAGRRQCQCHHLLSNCACPLLVRSHCMRRPVPPQFGLAQVHVHSLASVSLGRRTTINRYGDQQATNTKKMMKRVLASFTELSWSLSVVLFSPFA